MRPNMIQITDDLRIGGYRPLLPPAILMEELPISETAATLIANARKQTEAIVTGADDRLLAIVGPCSIHDPEAALEYSELLHSAA